MVLLRLFFVGMICYGTAITAQDLPTELTSLAARLTDLAKVLNVPTNTAPSVQAPAIDNNPAPTPPPAIDAGTVVAPVGPPAPATVTDDQTMATNAPEQAITQPRASGTTATGIAYRPGGASGRRPPTRKPTSSTEPIVSTPDSATLATAETIVPEDVTAPVETLPSTSVEKQKVRPTPPPKPSSFETMTQEEARTLLDLGADQTYTEIDIKTRYDEKKASTPVQDHYKLAYASSLLNALLMPETEARSLLDLTEQPALTEELIKTALADKLKTASEAEKTDLRKAALKLKHHGIAQSAAATPAPTPAAAEAPAQSLSAVDRYVQAGQDLISAITNIEATLSTWLMSWIPGAKTEYDPEDTTDYLAKITALQNAETPVATMLRQLEVDEIAKLTALQTKLSELAASVTDADAKAALETANKQLSALINNKSKLVEEQLD